MSMLDDLVAMEPGGGGCTFSRMRDTLPDDEFAEVWKVVSARGYSGRQKVTVLKRHGYDVTDQVMRRHSPHRLDCQTCRDWLSR